MNNTQHPKIDAKLLGEARGVDAMINYLKDYRAQLLCLCIMENQNSMVRESLERVNATLANGKILWFSGKMHELQTTGMAIHYMCNVYEKVFPDLNRWISLAEDVKNLLPAAKQEVLETFAYISKAKKDNNAMPSIRQEDSFFGGSFGVDMVNYE